MHKMSLFVSLFLVGLSCSEAPFDPDSRRPDSDRPVLLEHGNPNSYHNEGLDTILEIDSIVVIHLGEGHVWDGYEVHSDPVIKLHQYTDHEYVWYNLSILSWVGIGSSSLTFAHRGIKVPSIKANAFGPANSVSLFDMPNGQYNLYLRDRELTDHYTIEINDSLIILTPIDTNYTRPAHRLFWRYKPNSFALLCGTNTTNTHLCDEFVNYLKERLSVAEFWYSDQGAIPFPRAPMGHYYDALTRFFTFQHAEDFEKAGEILGEFTRSKLVGETGVSIWLWSWKNEKKMSWMMD